MNIHLRTSFDGNLVISSEVSDVDVAIAKEDVPEVIMAMQFWWLENKRLGNL